MFCAPSKSDRLKAAVMPLSRGAPDLYPEGDGYSLGAVDWNAFVQAIPGVLNTATQVYGQIERGKYNPYATYALPYGVTPSAAGVSWSGAINPATQGLPFQNLQSMQNWIPYVLIGGAALAVIMMLKR